MVNAFSIALGTVTVQSKGGKRTQPTWQPFPETRARKPRNLRVYEDFSGRSPEERQLYAVPTPALLKPSVTWTTISHRLSKGICAGENCEYEPKMASIRRGMSGCDAAWRRYSEVVFGAFREANPEIQYRERHPCLVELRQERHQCYTLNHTPVRSGPLDHDELCRFPDGEKLIISHRYKSEDDTFHEDLVKWQDQAPGVTARNGGYSRSWYFPRQSTLVIIGKAEILDRVNLDFAVPADSAPLGCVRWRDPFQRPWLLIVRILLKEIKMTSSVQTDNRCKLGIHCKGTGRIQVHVVQPDVLICIKCAAGEEGQTQKKTKEDLQSGQYGNLIHRARSTGHRC